MHFLQPLSACLLLFLLHATGLGQDRIYFTSGTKEGKTAALTLTSLTYTTTGKKAAPITVSTKKLVLLFNRSGDFLAFERLDFSNDRTRERITKFLNDTTLPEKDQIYSLAKSRRDDRIVTEDKNFIYLQSTAEKVDKKTLAAIIYRDGHHVLLAPPATAAVVLWENKSSGTVAAAEKPAPKKDAPVTEQAAPVPITETKKDTSFIPSGSAPAVTPDKTTAASSTTAPAHATTFEEVAGNVSKEEFEKKALQKTNQLNIYLKLICDKSANYEEINKAIDQSVALFVDENAMIETSSLNRNDVKRYKIRSYLSHIKLVNYDKIEIEWTNVQYVSDVKQGPDGNYYGVVSFEQVFRGYRDGKLVYQDVTRKNATVVLKTYEKNVEGNTKNVWDVLLSDIGVISTKSL